MKWADPYLVIIKAGCEEADVTFIFVFAGDCCGCDGMIDTVLTTGSFLTSTCDGTFRMQPAGGSMINSGEVST